MLSIFTLLPPCIYFVHNKISFWRQSREEERFFTVHLLNTASYRYHRLKNSFLSHSLNYFKLFCFRLEKGEFLKVPLEKWKRWEITEFSRMKKGYESTNKIKTRRKRWYLKCRWVFTVTLAFVCNAGCTATQKRTNSWCNIIDSPSTAFFQSQQISKHKFCLKSLERIGSTRYSEMLWYVYRKSRQQQF